MSKLRLYGLYICTHLETEKRGSLRGKSGDNLNNIDITSEFEIHKAESVSMAVIQLHGIKMVKKSLYEAAWILGLIAGIVCILFALFSFLGYIPEILEKPIKGLTGIVSAGVLGILGS
jgi:hypothetical protein